MQSQKQKKATRNKFRFLAPTILAVVALCLSVSQLGTAQKRLSNVSNAYPAAKTLQPTQPAQRKVVVIDGAQNPEKITDATAYAMVFRVIGNRTQENEKQRMRAYINQLGLGAQKCMTCAKQAQKEAADPEVDAMMEAARAYNEQVGYLDTQAKAIKEATWRNPTAEAKAELARLQREKESLLRSLIASLHKRLGPDATGRLTQQINQRVKQRIQIRQSVDAP